MTLFSPPQLPLAAASPLSNTKKPQSVIMRHERSTAVSRLLPYLAIFATRITHLLGWENKRILSHFDNNHFDTKGALENAKSPNRDLSFSFFSLKTFQHSVDGSTARFLFLHVRGDGLIIIPGRLINGFSFWRQLLPCWFVQL